MNKKIILFTLFTLCLSGAAVLGAEELVLYENQERGFSLSYPKGWEIEESQDRLQLYSSSEFAKNSDMEGSMFGVYNYTLSQSYTPERALKELLEIENAFKLDPATEKKFAGQTWWYIKAYNKERDIKAEFYGCTMGETLYIIAFGYKPSKSSGKFTPQLNAILKTFKFLKEADVVKDGLKLYENKELGISFSYPVAWKLDAYGNNVTVSSTADFLTSDKEGAGFAVFVGTYENFGLDAAPATPEELWEKLKSTDTDFKELSKKYRDWLGNKWYVVEFIAIDDNMRAGFYIRMSGDKIYMVGYIYRPPEAEATFKVAVEKMLASVRFFEPQPQK